MEANTGEDVSLPKATVQKIISEVLANTDITVSKEARDLIIDGGIEFIMILASMASDMADTENKKTITQEHVIKALEELEFQEFIPQLHDVINDHQKLLKQKQIRDSKLKKSGLSEEELIRQQEELFKKSRTRLNSQHQTPEELKKEEQEQ
ncbi:negative cofactor 2 transcription regulator complex subunit ncb2 [Hanseniaspora vineae]